MLIVFCAGKALGKPSVLGLLDWCIFFCVKGNGFCRTGLEIILGPLG